MITAPDDRSETIHLSIGVLYFHAAFCSFAALLALALPAAAQSALHLVPMPREVVPKPDHSLTSGIVVNCSGCDAEDSFAANDLQQTLVARGVPSGSGLRIVLQRLALHPDPSFIEAMKPEGYTIVSTPGTVDPHRRDRFGGLLRCADREADDRAQR